MVVRDLLLDSPWGDTIGGPPQVLKVHQHKNASAIAVWWSLRRQAASDVRPFLLGRPLLDYERGTPWILDPFTFRLSHVSHSPQSVDIAALSFQRGLALRALIKRCVQAVDFPRVPRPRNPSIHLIVLKCARLDRSRAFYAALGLQPMPEQHGTGPVHYSCTLGGVVLELYRASESVTDGVRLVLRNP